MRTTPEPHALRVSLTSAVTAVGEGTGAVLDAASAPQTVPRTAPAGRSGRSVAPIEDFDVRARLGRKGTRTLDRAAALALAAVEGLRVEGESQGRAIEGDDTGLVLGTTAGSVASTIDFTVDGLTGERPYLVDPARFPNTVMNFAAGQCAIRFGLRGPNATVATGRIAGLQAVRYAGRLLRGGQAARVLVGGVEELSPQRIAIDSASGNTAVLGEAGAVALLEPVGSAPLDPSGTSPVLVAGLDSGFAPGEQGPAFLTELVQRCSDGVAGETGALFPSSPGGADSPEVAAAREACGEQAPVIAVADVVGDTGAASVLLQLGAAAEWLTRGGQGNAVVTVLDPVGHVGVLILTNSGS